MELEDHSIIINKAWEGYDPSKEINKIVDISAKVSTNHVYRITFTDDDIVIAKLSLYGKYEYFKEDHRIINALCNNLLYPFENVLGKSLLKNNQVYTYRFQEGKVDAWVVFYNPIRTQHRLPRRLDEDQIRKLGEQIGKFHKACAKVKNVLPKSSKTLRTDIYTLLDTLDANPKLFGKKDRAEYLKYHCEQFLKNRNKLGVRNFDIMPVFLDWNIGNFSVTDKLELFSRWDYDWFRMSYRVLDFYFFSRVVSDIGDRTVFSYVIGPLMEDRFIIFLEAYHKVNPITANEILFLKEGYRFFILNYVIKDGNYFFNEKYAKKLQTEAFETYLPSIEKEFDATKILQALKLD
jgi:Ser/Thr protein kinase RdoA (MazF antagonist)